MGILVFVSYATIDSARYRVADVAAKLGELPDIDRVLFWEEHMDDDIFKYMNDNLGNCDALLLFCSKNALSSEAVQMEWMSALKLKKSVVPVFSDPGDIPPLLTTKLGVSYKENNFDATIDDIYQLILKKCRAAHKVEEEEKHQIKETVTASDAGGFSLEQLAKLVAQAIFNNESTVLVGETEYSVRKFAKSHVRYAEIKSYKFMEQNPNKKSEFAKMAREGSKIIWIMKRGRFYGRLIENEFVYL